MKNENPQSMDQMNERLNILNDITIPVWIFDIDIGQMLWANNAALDFWSASNLAELCNREMNEDMSLTVTQRLQQYQEDFNHGASFTELWTLYPNGNPRSVRCIFSGFKLSDGRMAMLCQALSEQSETPDALRSTQALLHTTTMISLYDANETLLYNNPAARNAYELNSNYLSKQFIDINDYKALMQELTHNNKTSMIAKVKTIKGTRWHEIAIRKSFDAVTGGPAYLVSEVDISKCKLAELKVQYLAQHDVMTGLPNRSFLQTEINKHIEKSKNTPNEFALLFIDLDHFKTINDSLGHTVGDQVLIEISKRLRAHIGSKDLAARLGGDEFIICLSNIKDYNNLSAFAKKLRTALTEPIQILERELHITPSIGISIFPNDGNNLDELMTHADLAMYDAKNFGRNRFEFFKPNMINKAQQRQELRFNIENALKEGQFELFYQPRISIEKESMIGVEALIRWNHPTRGLLSANEFISMAEKNGSIIEMSYWLWETAAKQQYKWGKDGYDLEISINLSSRQFMMQTLLSSISQIVTETECNPSLVAFEITETVLMQNPHISSEILLEMDKMGFKIAIDNFGTGYSNLAHLQHYPIDYLKIDQSFIKNKNRRDIAQLIIAMGKLLPVKIIAEGVEDQITLQWLKEQNCHQYQGFYYCQPIPANKIEELLNLNAMQKGMAYYPKTQNISINKTELMPHSSIVI